MLLQDGQFFISHTQPSGWTHVVMNYIGPNDGEGIRLYISGTEVGNDLTKSTTHQSAGDGRIVVGRWFTDKDEGYSSVKVDELIFFNHYLSSAEIADLATTT